MRWSQLPRRTVIRTRRIVGFAIYFAWEFLLANVEVLREILSPRARSAPAIIAVPLRCRTSLEIVSLANLITLTPGTLTMEVAYEPATLYVHGMFVHDPAEFLASLHDLEARLLAVLRPVGTEPTELPERR